MSRRVLILGAGAVGARAARLLAGFDEVGSLVIADRDAEAAAKAARDCGGKAGALVVDAASPGDLDGAVRGSDLVLNCVGPFFRFGEGILRAAVRTGADYLDVCDDPEPMRGMLALDAEARRAGVTAVVGLGTSPGLTNLLAAKVRARLDDVDMLLAAWNLEERDDTGREMDLSAVLVHWMRACSGAALESDRGGLMRATPLRSLRISYPGRGKRTVFTLAHPEPVAFASTWPEVGHAACAMVMPSAWIGAFRHFQKGIDTGQVTVEEAAKALVRSSQDPAWRDSLTKSLDKLIDGPRLPLLFVLGRGRRTGAPRTVAAGLTALPRGRAAATATPLALGAFQVLRGQTKGPGVLTPERALDQDLFWEMLAPYCDYPAAPPPDRLVEVQVQRG